MYISEKTENIIIIVLLIVIVILLIALFNPSMFVHFHYDNIAYILNPNFHCISEEYHIYVEDILVPEYEESIVQYISKTVEAAPLYENDYYIILTDTELIAQASYTKGRSSAGFTNTTKKIICINYNYLEYALLHEIGHAVDGAYNFTDKEEFEELYNEVKPQEKPSLILSLDDYMLLDIKEYFAENYRRYIYNELTDTELIEYFDKITEI